MTPKLQSINPVLPDYEKRMAGKEFKPLSINEISDKLTKSRNYWISTCLNDKPHSFPIWGIWFENKFSFSSGPNAKKIKNLLQNSNCTITTENANKPVIIEGIAYREKNFEELSSIVQVYNAKYKWNFFVKDAMILDANGMGGPVFSVQPQKVFAWNEFPVTFSKWIFK